MSTLLIEDPRWRTHRGLQARLKNAAENNWPRRKKASTLRGDKRRQAQVTVTAIAVPRMPPTTGASTIKARIRPRPCHLRSGDSALKTCCQVTSGTAPPT